MIAPSGSLVNERLVCHFCKLHNIVFNLFIVDIVQFEFGIYKINLSSQNL